ncbi:prepilin peptidase [Vibrio tapetis]|uniref:A24 family peptidase n=1 Tax=Vibrio tapetis TaxID=52443 RepID=UPI000C85F87C|nr:A24 family peptidase [Vibrio tapetis]
MNIEYFFETLLISLNFVIFILVCIYDGKYRITPNRLCKVALVTNVAIALINGHLSYSITIMFITFIILIVLWFLGVFGAGDVKLLCSLILGIHPSLVTLTLVTIGMFGGIQLIIMFILSRWNEKCALTKGIPYGIPIASSCFLFSTMSIYLFS